MKKTGLRCAILILVVAVVSVMPSRRAAASPPIDAACGTPEMSTDFYAFIEGVKNLRFNDNDSSMPERAVRSCQYRLFFDQQTFCFSEDDTFMGGVVWYDVVSPGGMSVGEAIEDVEQYQARVFLVADGGARQELEVRVTPIQSAYRPDLGHVVFNQHAVFLHLQPGTYETVLEDYHPANAADPPWPGCDTAGHCVATVHVRVFSRADALALGPSTGFGTVACPE